MKKNTIIFIGISVAIILIALVLFSFFKKPDTKDNQPISNIITPNKPTTSQIATAKEKLLAFNEWIPFTESDLITLAFGGNTNTTTRIIDSLKSNQPVICHSVGGTFDDFSVGIYFIILGFDESGEARILCKLNSYEEFTCPLEYALDGVQKIMFFTKEGV